MVEPFPNGMLRRRIDHIDAVYDSSGRIGRLDAKGRGKVKEEAAEELSWRKRGIGNRTNITLFKGLSSDRFVLDAIGYDSLDFIYLDGAHDYDNVKQE